MSAVNLILFLVLAPFWRDGARFVPGDKRRGEIHLSEDDAEPLLAMGLIGPAVVKDKTGELDPDPDPVPESDPVPEQESEQDPEPETREQLFAKALAMLDADNKDHFTNSGKPDVNALRDAGFDTTAAERDALFQAFNQGE